jgi:hypothetical protein
LEVTGGQGLYTPGIASRVGGVSAADEGSNETYQDQDNACVGLGVDDWQRAYELVRRAAGSPPIGG